MIENNLKKVRECDIIVNANVIHYILRINMNEFKNDNWINIDETAEYLGVRPGNIRFWIRKGKGVPANKIGKQWKFKYSFLNSSSAYVFR